MRLPNAVHEAGPWRIREIVPDFTLEDVWALPAHGGAEDFPKLLELGTSLDPANADSLPARALWRIRDRLGAWFDLGRISEPDDGSGALPIPGTEQDPWPRGSRTICATHRGTTTSGPCRSDRCTAPPPSRRRRSRTRPCTA